VALRQPARAVFFLIAKRTSPPARGTAVPLQFPNETYEPIESVPANAPQMSTAFRAQPWTWHGAPVSRTVGHPLSIRVPRWAML